MNTNPVQAYRLLSAQGSTPVGLVVQAYDQILSSIYSAVRAIEARDIKKKTADLNHALTLIAHLEGSLDLERGADVAWNLQRFYRTQRSEILAASANLSSDMLRRVADDFRSMREAWQEVERSATPTTFRPAAPSPSPSPRPVSARWRA